MTAVIYIILLPSVRVVQSVQVYPAVCSYKIYGAVMRNIIVSPTQQISPHSRGIPCSHKRGNDDRVTAV